MTCSQIHIYCQSGGPNTSSAFQLYPYSGITKHSGLQHKAESAECIVKMMTLLLRNSDAEAFEDSHVPFHLQLIELQALGCCLSVSVTLSSSLAQLTGPLLCSSSSSAASDLMAWRA